ncbi:hypothetical protein OG21DRAFT_1527538, partial [Imleria badia]
MTSRSSAEVEEGRVRTGWWSGSGKCKPLVCQYIGVGLAVADCWSWQRVEWSEMADSDVVRRSVDRGRSGHWRYGQTQTWQGQTLYGGWLDRTDTMACGEVGVSVGFVGGGWRSKRSDARGGDGMEVGQWRATMLAWMQLHPEASVLTLDNKAGMDIVRHVWTSADKNAHRRRGRLGNKEKIETGCGEMQPVCCCVSFGGVGGVVGVGNAVSSGGEGDGQIVQDSFGLGGSGR